MEFFESFFFRHLKLLFPPISISTLRIFLSFSPIFLSFVLILHYFWLNRQETKPTNSYLPMQHTRMMNRNLLLYFFFFFSNKSKENKAKNTNFRRRPKQLKWDKLHFTHTQQSNSQILKAIVRWKWMNPYGLISG